MSEVSAPQWPGTQITIFSQARQSLWCGAATKPVDEKQSNWYVIKHLFLEGAKQPKILAKKKEIPWEFFADAPALPMPHFQN